MRHDKPRQFKAEDGTLKWHYTTAYDREIYAVGYCSDILPCPDCRDVHPSWGTYHISEEQMLKQIEEFQKTNPGTNIRFCKTCNMKRIIKAVNPCPGHNTDTEACEHYKQYLLDTHLNFQENRPNPNIADSREKCQICSEWTHGVADVNGERFILCSNHQTKEHVSTLFKAPYESWSS